VLDDHDDNAAFTEFALARSRSMLRTAYLMTGDRQLSQDLVQDTLVRMFEVWDRVDLDNPAAYANTVLVRIYLSMRRRRGFFERPTDDLGEAAAPASDSNLRLTLFAALEQLTQADRTVVVLRYFCDLSVEDVAVQMNRTPAAVRTASRRALSRLRDVLGTQALAELAVTL